MRVAISHADYVIVCQQPPKQTTDQNMTLECTMLHPTLDRDQNQWLGVANTLS
jgi:hypothetical protein